MSVLIVSKSFSSQRDIKNGHNDIKLSKGAIYNIIHGLGNRREAKNSGLPRPPSNYPPIKASRTVVMKIERLTSKENPAANEPSQKPWLCHKDILPLSKSDHQLKAPIYERCLKTTLGKELPKLYPTDYDKVIVHHDKALSHTATFTRRYAKDLEARRGTKIIKNTLSLVKSPDISPMDFFGFGHVKQKMVSKRPTKMDGLWKLVNGEWREIIPEICQGEFSAWKKRCWTVAQVHREHIEQIMDIDNHRILDNIYDSLGAHIISNRL
ncbi:hypothetical protein Fcan01_24481 [Folsomia candida]|uniref:Uncharacterized protein n=1 Tax=Folsomia candida TaxID=158441 RepID=A0A226D6K4_FOLCA|nr:hypothetical protein Fcan01_24481 [Folsomia candida]